MLTKNTSLRICILFLMTLLVVGCGGAESRKEKYLQKGKAYLEQKNYDKARIELRNVLQIDPKYAEGYYLLGLVEEKKQNWQQSFGAYLKAIELNPDHFDARAKLGRFYLLSGDLTKATEMADAILAKKPDHADGLLLKATIASRRGNDADAIKIVSAVLEKDPGYPDAIGLLASLYFKQNNPEKAAEILEKGIAAQPKNIELRLELASFYIKKNQRDKVEAIFRDVIAVEPDKFEHQFRLASYLAQANEPDKAEKVLRDAIQGNPEDAIRYLSLADFLTVKKETKRAEVELVKAIQLLPKATELRFALATLYERTNSADKAIQTYQQIISDQDTKPDGLRARDKLANLVFSLGKTSQANDLINEVLKENPQDNAALLLKGTIALKQGDALNAIAALRSVLKDQPNSSEILGLLADAHLLNKEPDLAKETLQKALENNPKDIRTILRIAQFYVRTRDYNSALKETEKALKLSPDDFTALNAHVDILAAKNDIKGIEKDLGKIKKIYPDNPLGYYRMGQVYQSQKKYDLALREFESAFRLSHNGAEPMAGIVNVYMAQGKPGQAISFLSQNIKESPDNIVAHKILAEVYQSQKRYADAENELRRAIEINPKWNVPYSVLAGIFAERGDALNAIKICEQGLQVIPDDPQLSLLLAKSHEDNRDYNKAMAVYEAVLKKNPSNLVAANNLASLLADRKGDIGSLKRAKELALQFESSSQPAFRDTLGWVYYKSGETDKAVPLLEGVVKQAPNIPVFKYHLGMAYHKQGNIAEARKQLIVATQSKKDFPGLDEARDTLKKIQ